MTNSLADVFWRYHSFVRVHHGIDLEKEVDSPRVAALKPVAPPPEPLPSESDLSIRMPTGFQILRDRGHIGVATTAMVCNLIGILSDQEHSTLCKSSSRLEPPDMSSSLAARLGSFSLRPSSMPGEPAIENVIPNAVALYTARVVAGPLASVNTAARRALVHLIATLPQYTATRSEEEENALFWAWIVGIESLKTRFGELSSEGLKLRDVFARRFPRQHRSRLDAKPVLGRFFCDKVLWNDYERLLLQM